jgi:hypothetical protein
MMKREAKKAELKAKRQNRSLEVVKYEREMKRRMEGGASNTGMKGAANGYVHSFVSPSL